MIHCVTCALIDIDEEEDATCRNHFIRRIVSRESLRFLHRARWKVLPHCDMLRVRSFSRSTRSMSTSKSSVPHLPRLPVPPLRKTLDRYLRSIEPFLLEDEANGGPSFEESYKLRAGWADEFERGIGAKAQEKLIGTQSSNWNHLIANPRKPSKHSTLPQHSRLIIGWTILYG